MARLPALRGSLMRWIARAPYPARQWLLGAAYCVVPRRAGGLMPLIARSLTDLPRARRASAPDPQTALDNPDGFCGLTGPIGVEELMAGYRRGLFIMHHVGPLKWWAPRFRMALFFERARVEKTVRRLLRNQRFTITFDRAFAEVVSACASPRSSGTPLTWITPRVQSLFCAAHAAGHAHSVEAWQDGALVGGAFGLSVGRIFFTESQFFVVRDASKVAFAVLNRHLQAWGYAFNEGKHPTRYLADCGMTPITREQLSELTTRLGAEGGRPGRWEIDPALLDDRWEPAQTPGVRMADLLPEGSRCLYSVDELLTSRRSNTW